MLMKVKPVDFHAVEPHQREMDKRLHNWSRWSKGGNTPGVSPMFRMCPPPPRVRAESAVGEVVDQIDACRIAKGVAVLPTSHRLALSWAYIKPTNPRSACQSLGVSLDGLSDLLRDARQMLINRAV